MPAPAPPSAAPAPRCCAACSHVGPAGAVHPGRAGHGAGGHPVCGRRRERRAGGGWAGHLAGQAFWAGPVFLPPCGFSSRLAQPVQRCAAHVCSSSELHCSIPEPLNPPRPADLRLPGRHDAGAVRALGVGGRLLPLLPGPQCARRCWPSTLQAGALVLLLSSHTAVLAHEGYRHALPTGAPRGGALCCPTPQAICMAGTRSSTCGGLAWGLPTGSACCMAPHGLPLQPCPCSAHGAGAVCACPSTPAPPPLRPTPRLQARGGGSRQGGVGPALSAAAVLVHRCARCGAARRARHAPPVAGLPRRPHHPQKRQVGACLRH